MYVIVNAIFLLMSDDTLIYTMSGVNHSAMTDLQSDINNIHDWFNRNRLSVNVNNKSCTMSVPKRCGVPNCNINNTVLSHVPETKYLGVTLCNTLSWENTHIICMQQNGILYYPLIVHIS